MAENKPDRFSLLSEDPNLAKQGLSDKTCNTCGRNLWVNFYPRYICLNGCLLK